MQGGGNRTKSGSMGAVDARVGLSGLVANAISLLVEGTMIMTILTIGVNF